LICPFPSEHVSELLICHARQPSCGKIGGLAESVIRLRPACLIRINWAGRQLTDKMKKERQRKKFYETITNKRNANWRFGSNVCK